VQQTRSTDAEKTAEGVRNPEGGTRSDGSHHRTEGSASFREWTRRRQYGKGATSERIPGEEEFGLLRKCEEFRQRRERSEGEEKITRVNAVKPEAKRKWTPPDIECGRHGKTSRTRPATAKVEEEAGKRNQPLPGQPTNQMQCPTGTTISTP